MASVSRRPGKRPHRWWIRWYQDGKQHRVRFDGAYEAAKRKAAKIEDDKWVLPAPQSLAQPKTIGEWEPVYQAGRTGVPATRVARINDLALFVEEFGSQRFDQLTEDGIRKFLEKQRTAGNRKTGAPLAAATLFGHLTALKRMLAVAHKEGRLDRDLAAVVEVPKRRKHHIDPLTEAEVAIWLEVAHDTAEEVPIALGVLAGLRRGEMLSLRRSDVDLESAEIRIRTAISSGELGDPKSETSVRTIPCPSTLVAMLAIHFTRQDVLTPVPERQRDDRPVCTGRDWRAVTASWLTTLPERMTSWHGVRRIRLHDLRHTYATLLLERGIALPAVSRYLGHSSEAVTVMLYGHVTPRSPRDTRAALDQIAKPAEAADPAA